MPTPSAPIRPYIGGQAVLEGVMMRAPKSFAVVVRRADGSLHVRERAMVDVPRGFRGWPLIRGVTTLVESLRMGSEALRFSVEQAEADAEAVARRTPPLNVLGVLGLVVALLLNDDGSGNAPPAASEANEGKRGAGGFLMLAIAIGFFIALPQLAAAGINRLLGLGLPVQSAGFQAITGVLKLAIVVGYMVAIRRIPEIRRVFQYHGAEHKTISTYEAGEALTVANARAKTTLHPRCGTTFLVMVAIVSIVMFTLLGALLPKIATGSAVLDNVLFFAAKLPFLPVLVAVTFELQRVFARYFTTGPLRVLLLPGFWVQKITTAEPDDTQLEVALASLRVTLFRTSARTSATAAASQSGASAAHATSASEDDVRFADYEALVCADSLR